MKNSKTGLFVGLGIAFWFNGAMLVRLLGESFLTQSNPKLILAFLLAIPVTILTLFLTRIIGKVASSELLRPIVIMTFTATFLDGIALTWFQELYSTSNEVALHGAALILWGAGLGLLFAFLMETRGDKTGYQTNE